MSIPLPTALSTALPRSSDQGSGTSRSSNDLSRQAWRREMERAQSQAWFKQAQQSTGQDGDEPAARTAGMRPAGAALRPAAVAPVMRLSPALAAQPPGRHAGALVAEPYATRLAPPTTSALRNAGMEVRVSVASPTPVSLHTLPPSGPELSPIVAPPENRPISTIALKVDGAQEPVRVHMQWEGDAAKVWVGLNAEHAARLPHIADMVMRWLSGQGLRVLSLVCNGQVWAGGPDAAAPSFSDSFSASARPPSAQPDRDAFIQIIATTEF